VKRGDLIRELTTRHCVLKRHGANHDIYLNVRNGKSAPVPRHTEIRNTLAKTIRKQLGIEES